MLQQQEQQQQAARQGRLQRRGRGDCKHGEGNLAMVPTPYLHSHRHPLKLKVTELPARPRRGSHLRPPRGRRRRGLLGRSGRGARP